MLLRTICVCRGVGGVCVAVWVCVGVCVCVGVGCVWVWGVWVCV